MSKVFCIGFNKTGTSSLHRMFRQVGMRSYHGTDWWHWPAEDRRWRQYDAFSDGWPTGSTVRCLLRRYPTAKFILNTRRLDDWLLSRYHHIERNKRGGSQSQWLDNSDEAIARWIDARRRYHAEARRIFDAGKRRRQLIVVDFCGVSNEHLKIFAFLGIPLLKRLRLDKPHANRNRDKAAKRTANEQRLLRRWSEQNRLGDHEMTGLDV
jgi:hypothetical protein